MMPQGGFGQFMLRLSYWKKLIEMILISNQRGNLTSHSGLRLCQIHLLRNDCIDWNLTTFKFVLYNGKLVGIKKE